MKHCVDILSYHFVSVWRLLLLRVGWQNWGFSMLVCLKFEPWCVSVGLCTAYLNIFVCAFSLVVHEMGSSDIAELVSSSMQKQERPGDVWELCFDAAWSRHQLHCERYAHTSMINQLIWFICLHLQHTGNRVQTKGSNNFSMQRIILWPHFQHRALSITTIRFLLIWFCVTWAQK